MEQLQALGIAQGAIDHCKKYVTEHMQGEHKISEYQFTQFELADMQAKADAARLLVYRAAQAKQDHEPFSHLAGYDGYTRDYPLAVFSHLGFSLL